jgi:hypothetical protein
MSAEHAVHGDAGGDESGRDDGETCRAPNCWRNGHAVRVAGQTACETVLCERHRRTFLGVGS